MFFWCRSGPEKGRLLEELVASQAPVLALELGTFMGYGAIRIACSLPPGGRLVSVEASAEQVGADAQVQLRVWLCCSRPQQAARVQPAGLPVGRQATPPTQRVPAALRGWV